MEPIYRKELVDGLYSTVVDGIPVFTERNDETGPKGKCLVEPGEVGKPLVMMPWE